MAIINFVSARTIDTTTSKGEDRFYYVNGTNDRVGFEGVPMRVKPSELGTIAKHLYANRHTLVCNEDSNGNKGVVMVIGEYEEVE